jgi:hypothetical protein
MLIMCTNKGCLKQSNALLDESSGDVICQECGKPIENVSSAMKRTLKSFGQIVRSNEKRAFMMACRNCRANREIVLDQDNNTLCKICHSLINTTASFKLAMEESGVKLERIVLESENKEEDINLAKKKSTKKKKAKK